MQEAINEARSTTTTTRGMCMRIVGSCGCFGVGVPLSSAIASTLAGGNERTMNPPPYSPWRTFMQHPYI
jgi:hypothetical protein